MIYKLADSECVFLINCVCHACQMIYVGDERYIYMYMQHGQKNIKILIIV